MNAMFASVYEEERAKRYDFITILVLLARPVAYRLQSWQHPLLWHAQLLRVADDGTAICFRQYFPVGFRGGFVGGDGTTPVTTLSRRSAYHRMLKLIRDKVGSTRGLRPPPL